MKLPSLNLPDKIFGIDSAMLSTTFPVVLTLIAVIAGTNLLIVPKYESYMLTKSGIKIAEDSSESLLAKIRYLKSVDPATLKRDIDYINSALLPQKNAYLLVDIVRRLADANGFQVDSFSISPGKMVKENEVAPKTGSGVPKVPIKVDLIVPKSKYLDLLKSFEKSLPVLSLTSFKMTSQNETIKLDVDISAFYIQDEQKFDINTLTLADLTMEKSETDLLATISQYTIMVQANSDDSGNEVGGEFKKYQRKNPFNP